ncbi:MAG: thiamine phosphate synthase [Bacteroides sp.]|nr:thiamine phosphate synthase [Bacteroides sp.]
MNSELKAKSRVQFITHFTERYSYLDSARLALEGGCKWIQLRMKDTPVEKMEPIAIEVQRLCREHDAVFIIDDHVELVKKLGADGVHLGREDMPIHEVRKLLGDGFIIGGTANNFFHVQQHYIGGADYIGCGPYRFTRTKKKLSPTLGTEGYVRITSQMKEKGIGLPIVAIGGITDEDIPALMQTGVTGIALSGSILRAENPVEEMKKIINLMARG